MTEDARKGRTRHRVRQAIAVVLLLAVGGVGAWAMYQEASGRTAPPRFTREGAERAMSDLRRARGERWAPDKTRRAERAVRERPLERAGVGAADRPAPDRDRAGRASGPTAASSRGPPDGGGRAGPAIEAFRVTIAVVPREQLVRAR